MSGQKKEVMGTKNSQSMEAAEKGQVLGPAIEENT